MLILIMIASHLILGCVAFAFGRFAVKKNLANLMTGLSDTTSNLVGSADQVSSLSRDLGAASQEQLETLMTTVSASHQIRSMVEATSENTIQLNTEALHLKEMAQAGGAVIGKMVTSSQDIKRGAEGMHAEMQESMDRLNHALGVIQGIKDKTKVIGEIVFQTKMLSFNASVEAARAGEAGKSFSVVAEEVGKLSQMSGVASNEISAIVEESVMSVQSAINTTREKIGELSARTIATSDAGFQDAKACETIFSQMMEKVALSSQMIEQISSASKEQTQGVTQLDQTIHALQEVADRNRLVASQTTEFGREFEAETRTLASLTQKIFTLGSREAAPRQRLQKFIWNDKLVLGVDAMDAEHKILVEKINDLVSELENQTVRRDKEALLESFLALASYVVEHFSDEEKFLAEIGYPQLGSHKKIHQKLLAQVKGYENSLRAGTLDEKKLVSFLRGWLISHIMGVDMQYADFHQSQRRSGGARRAA